MVEIPDDLSHLASASEQQIRHEHAKCSAWGGEWLETREAAKRDAWLAALANRAAELQISLLKRSVERTVKGYSNAYMLRQRNRGTAQAPIVTKVVNPIDLQWELDDQQMPVAHKDWPESRDSTNAHCDFQICCLAEDPLGMSLTYSAQQDFGEPWRIRNTNIVLCVDCIDALEREEPYARAVLAMIQSDKRGAPDS